jgi:hypothetical protein
VLAVEFNTVSQSAKNALAAISGRDGDFDSSGGVSGGGGRHGLDVSGQRTDGKGNDGEEVSRLEMHSRSSEVNTKRRELLLSKSLAAIAQVKRQMGLLLQQH